MKKIINIVLSCSLALGAVTISSLPVVTSVSAAEASFNITSETKVQQEQLAAFTELKAMFDSADVNITEVKSKYIENFRDEVVASNPEIDAKITFVLDATIDGQMTTGQAKQAVDKGLQWFFYTEMTTFTKSVVPQALAANNKTEAIAALDKAIELYRGSLQGTAQKRDDKFNTNTKDLLDTVIIPHLQEAVNENDIQKYNETRQMFDKTLIKVFVQATLTYAEKIPQETDAEKARAAVTEGYFFFMPISNSLKGGSTVDAEYIENSFASGDPTKIDFEKIKDAMYIALTGKVSGYVQKTLKSMEDGNIASARVTAMEGNMFVAAQEVLLTEKVGEEVFNQASHHAKLYFDAVAEENKSQAELHSLHVLQFLAKANGVQLKLNSKTLVVNGIEKEVDAAAFIDPNTNRTLVPARFIAESLGAEVDYISETQTVVIEKGEIKVELVVNSDVVVMNGVVLEGVKLDQTVVLKDGRSFIPLRAVAEILNNKVFYAKGEIVIVK
jgi:hypothetical protein